MATQWYFGLDGQEHGTVSPAALKQMAAMGEIGPGDWVRPSDQQQWYQASSITWLVFAGVSAATQAQSSLAELASAQRLRRPSDSAVADTHPSSRPHAPLASRSYQNRKSPWLATVICAVVVLMVLAVAGTIFWFFWTQNSGTSKPDTAAPVATRETLTDKTLAAIRKFQAQAEIQAKAGDLEAAIASYEQAIETGQRIYPKSTAITAAIDEVKMAKQAVEEKSENARIEQQKLAEQERAKQAQLAAQERERQATQERERQAAREQQAQLDAIKQDNDRLTAARQQEQIVHWQICPACHGTGHDVIAERYEISRISSQVTSGSIKVPMPNIPCPLCKGAGRLRVP